MTPETLSPTGRRDFAGLTVAAFESRMAKEMAALIERHGGRPLVAPSMREVPLAENREALEMFERLERGDFDLLILMTGVGTRALVQALETRHPREKVLAALGKVPLLARGPKPVKALAEMGLQPALTVPEPNTWKDVLATLDAQKPVRGLKVAVQEYGVSNPEFLQALKDRGAAQVVSVPVYQWDLPEDVKPLLALIDSLLAGEAKAALFTSGQQARNLLQVARGAGKEQALLAALKGVAVASIGPVATEVLGGLGIGVDLEPEHPKMGFLVKEASEKCAGILEKKSAASPPVPKKAPPLEESLFLKACRREPVHRTPLWIMRQAGRYLPEYREVRSKVSFLELCKTPELACEVTVKAQEVLGVDAAILFADILLIAEPLGFKLEFLPAGGPVIRDPFRGASDLDRLREVDPKRDLGYVLEAVRRIRKALRPDVPLIGFAGAPFTLASYLIEGGGSKGHEKAKALLKDAEAWDPLMGRLTAATQSYLNAQVEAGAQAVQLFDSWVGVVTPEEYKSRILPYLQLLIRGLKKGVPVIYFGLKTAPFFPFLKETGATVIGVDGRQPLDVAWKALGNVAVQGNLDPEVLLTDPATVRAATEKVLKLAGGRPGHIFNLGHGILPDTPMENVRAMIEIVKDWKNKN